jgi:hypothetical protein
MDPKNAERRRRGQSRGGKNKPSRELVGLKAQLQDLIRDVLSGELESGRAAVANQLINTHLRAIELERKIRETDELEEANRENRRIIAALTSRIPALETPENAPESPEPGAEMPVGPTPSEASEAAQEPSERISWWRRMLG